MYKLNYTPEFQIETGYRQDCDLLFADFLDAIKHARNVAMMLYPSLTQIMFRGRFDDYGHFRVIAKCVTRFPVPPIAVITLS